MDEDFVHKVVKIQKLVRGFLLRINRLPNIMHYIKNFLLKEKIVLYDKDKEGRLNSSLSEKIILDLLLKKFSKKIRIAKSRKWYDLLAHDHFYGWIPINIKITTMKTADNVGNLSICVHSYTDMNLHNVKNTNNGVMYKILLKKLANKQYNKTKKKDYYFLVINKNNTKNIIINSVKGLQNLTPNNNNLPFQVCWKKNRHFKHKSVKENVKMFMECLKKPSPSWQEIFLAKIREM